MAGEVVEAVVVELEVTGAMEVMVWTPMVMEDMAMKVMVMELQWVMVVMEEAWDMVEPQEELLEQEVR